MMTLPVLNGCRTLQLYRKVGGSNAHPSSIEWGACESTLIDEDVYIVLNKHRWLSVYDGTTKSHYARRRERVGNQRIHVFMAREVLGLPLSPGTQMDKADHISHDTLDNTRSNLRVVNNSQSAMNRRKFRCKAKFKGVSINPKGRRRFAATVFYKNGKIRFDCMERDVDAAFMYNCAAKVIHGEFAHVNEFDPNDLPDEVRQMELERMVMGTLERLGITP